MRPHLWLAQVCGAVHAVTLTLWIGLLVAAGVAAAGAFSTLPDLGISLRGHEGFVTADPADHGRIAAGRMLERVFTAVDLGQIPLAAIALTAFGLQVVLAGDRWRRPPNIIRASCMLIAAGFLAIHLTMIAPPMNRELQSYWAAAEAGDTPTALAHRAAFDKHHPRAEAILQINLLILFTAAAAAGVSGVPGVAADSRPRHSELGAPLLSRR